MGVKKWNVEISKRATSQLALITDRRIQDTLKTRLRRLNVEPDKQGKRLGDELNGYYSVRAVGQRYSIIYRIEDEQVLVLVVLVGIRKEGDKNDVYALAKKLVERNKLD